MSYRPPFYKRFPQDYLASSTTRKMTLAEHGVYNLLLDYAWLEEQTATLPADVAVLSRLTGIRKQILSNFAAKYPQLFIKVASNPQLLCNPRLKAEHEEFLETCEKNRLAGRQSAKARQVKSTLVQHPLNHKELDRDKEVREHQHHTASVSPADLLDVETRTAAFDLFWEKWPKKQSKSDALRAWVKIPISEYAAVTAGLGRWLTSDQWKREWPRYIPKPATWLNQKRWMDEDVPQSGGSNAPRTNGKPSVSDNMRATLAAFRVTEQKFPA
jgi:uncharacterized protein YdaU (DUF1376 family)